MCLQCDSRCSASSQAGFSWGHKLPTKSETAAGIAAEEEREQLLQQKQQQVQALQEASLLKQSSVSSSQPRHTGAFTRLPMVPVSAEIIESALKRAGRIAANKKLKNEAQKARSRCDHSRRHHTVVALSMHICHARAFAARQRGLDNWQDVTKHGVIGKKCPHTSADVLQPTTSTSEM